LRQDSNCLADQETELLIGLQTTRAAESMRWSNVAAPLPLEMSRSANATFSPTV